RHRLVVRLAEDALQDLDHEVLGRVVVIVQEHLPKAGFREFFLGFGSNLDQTLVLVEASRHIPFEVARGSHARHGSGGPGRRPGATRFAEARESIRMCALRPRVATRAGRSPFSGAPPPREEPMSVTATQTRTVAGHPPGLFVLFFAEMWERLSYYWMRALLVFYMIRGLLAFDDARAYAVYGAYTALVYATRFVGGLLADRLIGARHAVVIGGALMAAGHLVMSVENEVAFFTALALLIVGNGF